MKSFRKCYNTKKTFEFEKTKWKFLLYPIDSTCAVIQVPAKFQNLYSTSERPEDALLKNFAALNSNFQLLWHHNDDKFGRTIWTFSSDHSRREKDFHTSSRDFERKDSWEISRADIYDSEKMNQLKFPLAKVIE